TDGTTPSREEERWQRGRTSAGSGGRGSSRWAWPSCWAPRAAGGRRRRHWRAIQRPPAHRPPRRPRSPHRRRSRSRRRGPGGACCGDAVAGGMAYTPATNSWEELPPAPLAGRQSLTGAWDGSELILVGGSDADGNVFSGAAAYDPARRSWRRLPALHEPRTG